MIVTVYEHKAHVISDLRRQIKELKKTNKNFKPLSCLSRWKLQQIQKKESELLRLANDKNEVTMRRIG